MQVLLLPLMAYAACGLVLSVVIHVLSFFGPPPGGQNLFSALHIGIFPLWFAVVLISHKLTANARRRDFWKAALSGCPAWLRYMTYGFFAYAVVNFVIFIAMTGTGAATAGPSPVVWHGFSGHWMAFYSAGLAVVTSAHRRGFATLQPKCLNGHDVGYGDRYCSNCGAPVDPTARIGAA